MAPVVFGRQPRYCGAERAPSRPRGGRNAMELVGRMMDGSFFGGAGPQPSSSGSGIDEDDRIERLEQVPLFQSCSRRQLKAIARICETFDVPAGTVLTRTG